MIKAPSLDIGFWFPRPDRGARLAQELRQRGHRVTIYHSRPVPEEHVRALYALSAYTIYPSLLEGFGIPILEAFNCGSPVLTSNITSMPEVAGGAAHLVDPYNVAHIAAAMVELVTNASLREGLRQRGFERARFFSWEKTAGIIMENLTMVL